MTEFKNMTICLSHPLVTEKRLCHGSAVLLHNHAGDWNFEQEKFI